MKKFKIEKLLIFAFLTMNIGLASTVNENINELMEARIKYENNKEKVKEVEIDMKKEKLNIYSGKEEAIQNIAVIFDYYKTSIYEIFTKPNFTTSIKLSKDENIVYVGGGDTENWMIDETSGGEDGSSYLLVKPNRSGLKTNLNIITNKRTYFVSLSSNEKSYNPLVIFKYPFENQLKFISRDKEKKQEIKLEKSKISEIDFDYKWDKNSKISPIQVFNDGSKTVIVLEKKLQEAPVVYIYGIDGELSIVNTRMIDNKIIIDKVVNRLQLVLGKTTLEIYK